MVREFWLLLLRFCQATLPGAYFWYVFSISVALSLLPTYILSFLLFGRDCGFAVLGLATFSIQTSQVVILLQRTGHKCFCNVVEGNHAVIHRLFKRMGGGDRVYNRDSGVSSP